MPRSYFVLDFTNSRASVAVLSKVLQWILKIFGFAFKVLLMPLDFFLASQVDRLVAMYSFLKVLVGPYLIQPSQAIFFLSSRNIFGFMIPNPYDQWSSDKNCGAPEAYARNGL